MTRPDRGDIGLEGREVCLHERDVDRLPLHEPVRAHLVPQEHVLGLPILMPSLPILKSAV